MYFSFCIIYFLFNYILVLGHFNFFGVKATQAEKSCDGRHVDKLLRQ